MIQAEDLHAALDAVVPIKGGMVEVHHVSDWEDSSRWVVEDTHGNLRVTLRLVVYDRDASGVMMIRDIKEQTLVLVSIEHRQRDVAIMSAYIQGWAAALVILFEADSDDVYGWMPWDLAFPRVLGLVRSRTAEDFCRAFLVKSRLGKAMPDRTP